jgi:modulator of FtsH protease HflK
MAWNEPGGGNRDPWNPKGGRGGDGNLPDVDQMLERLKARFKGKGPRPGGLSSGGAGLVAGAIALVWLASGFYMVDEQEQAVIMRLGAFAGVGPSGLNWHFPWPIETVEKVNVTQVRQVTERSDMLTQDENIVDVEVKIQYIVSSAENYLFSQADPDVTLRQVTKSAVREVIGRTPLDSVLSGAGRLQVAQLTQEILEERLDAYKSGLQVSEINLQNVQAPEAVQDAFIDAIKAREDQERLKNEALAYRDDRLPRAGAPTAPEKAEAIAYRDRLIARASGESERFNKLLTEYRKAPRVTRDRLYMETMSQVMGNSTKVLVDVDRNGPMIYLPLDQLNKAARSAEPAADPGGGASPASGTTHRCSRDRGGR